MGGGAVPGPALGPENTTPALFLLFGLAFLGGVGLDPWPGSFFTALKLGNEAPNPIPPGCGGGGVGLVPAFLRLVPDCPMPPAEGERLWSLEL